MTYPDEPRLWHPPHLGPGTMRAFVGRQGIFTRRGEAVGHELLYRAEGHAGLPVDSWSAADQDRATEHVIAATFWRDPDITSPLPAFVNFTGSYLRERDVARDCDPRRVVIEIVESTIADRALVARIAALRDQGFRFALDDFVGNESQEQLLPWVDFVKIDWRDLLVGGPSLLDAARRCGGTLIAERVEDRDVLTTCEALGFDLYQGWWFEQVVMLDRGLRDLEPVGA